MEKFKNMEKPTLVSGTDGVGTKIKLAFLLNKHDTVGIDCVAMCVNDVICCGAKPLFFLDYIACGKNVPEKIADIVKGVSEGCVQSDSALVGGETAEMPGFYPEDEFDLAGFSVGIVDKKNIVDNNSMEVGDVVIALPSSGVHSNGFSLVRKIFDIDHISKEDLTKPREELLGKSLGETLLTPTVIYVKPVMKLLERIKVKGISHITGGGFYENVPRMLKEGTRAVINKDSYEIPAIFRLLQKTGSIEDHMMYNTYNMGIGMVLAVKPQDKEKTMAAIEAAGEKAYEIGRIVAGDKGVDLV
jgi:phosphoribosylformylglycinamidine cyclo-ligase